MVRPHATPSQPRSARPSTTKLVESASQAKERTTSTRKRGATEDLLNPNKKSSKSKKTDSWPRLDLSNDPPYDQVGGTFHRLIAGWKQVTSENQKLEQKLLLRKDRETELKEQVKKLTLMQRAAYVYTLLDWHDLCAHHLLQNRKNNDDARSYNVALLNDGAKLQALRNCNTNEEIPGFPRTTKHIDRIDNIQKVHRLLKEIVQDYFPSRTSSLLVTKDILRNFVGRPERDTYFQIQRYLP